MAVNRFMLFRWAVRVARSLATAAIGQFVIFGCIVGCGGDARLELAASDTLQAVADQMVTVIEEYHGELSRYDESRESAIVSALVNRIKADVDDASAIEDHVSQFKSALNKIREDRGVEWSRRWSAIENVRLLREVAGGLQKLAIESLTLQDEMRRYLDGWLEARREAKGRLESKGVR